jgi:glycosyltransferase involved in cell wall biosynthesis
VLPGGSIVRRIEPPVNAIANLIADVQATNVVLESAGEAVVRASGPFDVLHVHDWMVATAGIALKHLNKTPLVATIHATERGRTGGDLATSLNIAVNGNEWWLCYEAWRVIATSRYMAAQVEDYFRVPADKIDVIPNGVDRHKFDALPARDDVAVTRFRRRFAADDEKLVVHVGRLVGEKGAPVLVDAAPAVLAAVPDAKFVVAGKGPLLSELRLKAEGMGLGAKFYFTGFISDADRDLLYRAADVAVFPSLYEPFGIVALEAMAAGTPVVVAASGGLAEIVEHGETGIHAYPGSADSLAWAIVHTLEHPDWALARARAALRRLEQVFDWGLIAQQTAAVYRRVAEERAASEW